MGRPRILLRGVGPDIEGLQWESDTLLRVGRLASQEVVLNDASVSRRHAELRITPIGWVIRDQGSSNGTYLNGIRLGEDEEKLHLNDLLQFGDLAVLVAEIDDGRQLEASADDNATAGTDTRLRLTASPGMNLKTSGSFLKVQAAAKNSWEDAVELVVSHSHQRLRQGKHLLTLLRAGYHLSTDDSLDRLLQSILNDTIEALEAQRGCIILADEFSGQLLCRSIAVTRKDLLRGNTYSRTLAHRCYHGGDSLLCRDVSNDIHLLSAGSVSTGAMASIICALLRTPRRRLGVLHLDRGPFQDPFTQDDFYLADAIAANVSVGIESSQLVEKERLLFLSTVQALARAVEARDSYTGNHTHRVCTYALLLARELRLPQSDCQQLQVGTPLHDIGKIAIDDSILRKPGRLTPAEFELMKSHTIKGAAILQSIPGLVPMIPIIRNHHERWDGKGYPDRLAGKQIDRLARIVAVADAFDAMTSDRPYRRGMPVDAVLEYLQQESGSHFDPECVQAFLRLRQQVKDLSLQLPRQEFQLGTYLEPAQLAILSNPEGWVG